MGNAIGDEVGFWSPSLDDNNVGTSVLEDRSVSSNNGTIVGATWVANTDSGGTRALSFDGVDDQVDIGDVAELDFDLGDSWTFSVWIKPSSTEFLTIGSKYDPGNDFRGYDFYVNSGNRIVTRLIHLWSAGERVVMEHRTGFSLVDAWHHVVYQYDGSGDVTGMKVWIDGEYVTDRVAVINQPFSGTITNSRPFIIGAQYVNTNPFNGLMDDYRVFGRNLPQNQIELLASSREPSITLGVPFATVLDQPMMGC